MHPEVDSKEAGPASDTGNDDAGLPSYGEAVGDELPS